MRKGLNILLFQSQISLPFRYPAERRQSRAQEGCVARSLAMFRSTASR